MDMRTNRLNRLLIWVALATPAWAQTPSNIQISGGISRGVSFLSVPDDGSKSDLYFADDASGRQRWSFRPGPNHQWYNILVSGGITNERKYLSVTSDGTKVDLFPIDDGSGRQRWVVEQLPGGFVHIRIFSGVQTNRKYLSVTSDGGMVDLFPMDDGSGRQRWKISGANSLARSPEPVAEVAGCQGNTCASTTSAVGYPPPPAGVPGTIYGHHQTLTIDLNGNWEGYYASPGIPTAIRIRHQGNHIEAELLHDNLTGTETTFFKGDFEPGTTTARVQVLDMSGFSAFTGASSGSYHSDMFGTVDFDHVAIANHQPFQRLSLPSYNDIPCSSANEKSVGAEWAYMRAVVAQRAKDMQVAVCWLYIASIQGDARAEFYLAYCLHDGVGTDPNRSQALQWAMKSAQNGSDSGAYLVGYLYDRGDGVTASAANATYWRQRGDTLKRRKREQADAEKQQERHEQRETFVLAAISVVGLALLDSEITGSHVCDQYRLRSRDDIEYIRQQLTSMNMHCVEGRSEPVPDR